MNRRAFFGTLLIPFFARWMKAPVELAPVELWPLDGPDHPKETALSFLLRRGLGIKRIQVLEHGKLPTLYRLDHDCGSVEFLTFDRTGRLLRQELVMDSGKTRVERTPAPPPPQPDYVRLVHAAIRDVGKVWRRKIEDEMTL